MSSVSGAAGTDNPCAEIRVGELGVKISRNTAEVEAAQRLRYQIFFEEMGGIAANPNVVRERRDFDEYDALCDHLLVLDYSGGDRAGKVVGTYRLLRRGPMQQIGRFYSEHEFDISAIKAYPGEILELGRSCVHADYRNRSVMQLLWRGIGEYIAQHKIELMFGCASFKGTDVQEHAAALSYLYHRHLAPKELRPVALPMQPQTMNLLPLDQIDEKAALQQIPALIKGYLRLNGMIGDGMYIDREVNSVDVSVVVKTDLLTEKYVKRYKVNGDAA